jgi:hypothetical protein
MLVMAAWDEMFPDCKLRVLKPDAAEISLIVSENSLFFARNSLLR